ncbi:hypothetical protein I79_025272 [Cricetulus griseus]|uniref:Uncharacterized protein n=1 Tax=Cricetulus griseus TaxID=10029 RepID=G3IMW8_CRIGR|nr:hypothetical protein I79_025272 [Cricetulus griseus]
MGAAEVPGPPKPATRQGSRPRPSPAWHRASGLGPSKEHQRRPEGEHQVGRHESEHQHKLRVKKLAAAAGGAVLAAKLEKGAADQKSVEE